ncbi:hypothetical protein BU14_0262s0008 [Porphyra umbilicalis]|uniref:Uncharacterized protein n=1 Tax=Porphyra umbilicalis TaxID=2786 RepID=A0A1X6P1Z0_PORUM|nr:hypothetical protein BU14_0262s0008 [Porphyra umbilicalis]|eukprot:OSX74891.1 hypothetical protein BU14_0262s0008 [Porphyra umbilicalis]
MRAALAKEVAPRQTVSPGPRMGDFGQDAGGMVDPDDDYEDEWGPPPAADNENDADAGAVAGLASDARSMPQELEEMFKACRERGEATANDEASGVNGASQPPRLRESDLVSICEAIVARSVGTERVAAAVGGASSTAGSGRGPRQTSVLLKDVGVTPTPRRPSYAATATATAAAAAARRRRPRCRCRGAAAAAVEFGAPPPPAAVTATPARARDPPRPRRPMRARPSVAAGDESRCGRPAQRPAAAAPPPPPPPPRHGRRGRRRRSGASRFAGARAGAPSPTAPRRDVNSNRPPAPDRPPRTARAAFPADAVAAGVAAARVMRWGTRVPRGGHCLRRALACGGGWDFRGCTSRAGCYCPPSFHTVFAWFGTLRVAGGWWRAVHGCCVEAFC